MRYRSVGLMGGLLMAMAVGAQTVPAGGSGGSDVWTSRSAAASSASYPAGSVLDRNVHAGPFKFRQRGARGALDQPPPRATDKAAVMGTERAWQNGRPPLDCAQTPMDPACH